MLIPCRAFMHMNKDTWARSDAKLLSPSIAGNSALYRAIRETLTAGLYSNAGKTIATVGTALGWRSPRRVRVMAGWHGREALNGDTHAEGWGRAGVKT